MFSPKKKTKIIDLIAFLLLLSFASLVNATEQERAIPSPDGKLIARILPIQKTKEGPPEFKIEVIDAGGKLAAREDFTSKTGNQGLSIDKAEWSPDSQFFVFSTFSSGGHMAWQFPTFFFARRDNRIYRFADFLPPIAEGDFTLKSPDTIAITIWTPMTTEKPLDRSIELPITFKMRDLTRFRNEQK